MCEQPTDSDRVKQITDEPKEDVTVFLPLAHNLDSEKKRTIDVQLDSVESETQEVTSTSQVPALLRFSDLQLSPSILKGLTESGFIRPSPVQIKSIPLGRMGLDLIVQAKSGTGKTVVFSVVLLEAIDTRRPVLQALVLAPTREIALQSQNVLERLGAHLTGLKCRLFVGGLPLADNLKQLPGCHIAVGTPGRVRYLIETGYMSTENIHYLVLDEADLLLAGGAESNITGGSANNAFPADINYIWWSLPTDKQMMALSATYTDYLVEEHLQRYMNDPVLIRLAAHDPALLGVRQFFAIVEPSGRTPASIFASKISYLCKLLSSIDFQQCLIFSNFHSSAQDLCDSLHSRGWPVSYISSNLDQNERFRAFNRLRAFHCRVLVSTDLTSRGIDAENVNLVISLEIPWEHEIYLHRVGRAGRFGSYGASVLIVADVADEMNSLRRLQSRCSTTIHKLPEPTPADLAAPDCPVDLSSLVTVVNCIKKRDQKSEPPKHPANSQLGNRRIPSHPSPSTLFERNIAELPVNSSIRTTTFPNSDKPVKQEEATLLRSKLPQELNAYLDQAIAYQESCGKHEGTTSTSVSIDLLEDQLLKSVEALYDARLPSTSECLSSVRPVGDGYSRKSNFPLPVKELPKYIRKQLTPEQSSSSIKPSSSPSSDTRPPSVAWTPRQLAAWYEYHNLVHYAHWYRASWELAMNEYKNALDRWNAVNMAT